MRILVVDDEPSIRDVCERLLRRAGHQTVSAASGAEALPRLSEGWDIVLTDLLMPGGVDGNEVVRRTRAAGGADAIVMTAFPDVESAIQAMRDGAYDYLIKPFSDDAATRTKISFGPALRSATSLTTACAPKSSVTTARIIPLLCRCEARYISPAAATRVTADNSPRSIFEESNGGIVPLIPQAAVKLLS